MPKQYISKDIFVLISFFMGNLWDNFAKGMRFVLLGWLSKAFPVVEII